jgi:GT2 family glycosyltransferase
MVSILIPTRDQPELLAACLESLTRTNYKNYHVIVIDNQSVDPKTQQVLRKYRNLIQQVIPYPHRFNYAGINNLAAEVATGDYLCFMNNDVEASDADWLNEMVSHLQREDVGAVGAKLLWPNGMVQHAGVVLGLHGLAGHQGNLWYQQDGGYVGYNQVTREVSAVTAACMLVRRQDFLAVGGFDAINFPVAFNDVDLCLKLRKAGYRILWTPHAELIHHESVSRGADDHPAKIARLEKEIRALRNRWGEALLHDPYYNRNLSLRHFSHAGLACPPRPVPANSAQWSGLV